jgi:outer membrane protein
MCHLLRSTRPLAVAALLALPGAAAMAQAFDAARLFGAVNADDAGYVGLAVVEGWQYPGSDERRTLVFPALGYEWKNGWFAGTGNGVGYNFARVEHLQYGLRVTADFGRNESRSSALRGMGDIDARPEVGGFYNFFPSREMFLTSSLRYGSGNDRDGLVVDLGAGYLAALPAGFRLGLGASVSLVNNAYMQSYFGVSAAQAKSSGYPVYSAAGGVRDVRASASLTYPFNASTSVTAALSYSALQGGARSSPLVRQADSLGGVLALVYGF